MHMGPVGGKPVPHFYKEYSMLKIYLYKFTKKTNSTARPGTPYLTLDCAIKTPSSILRPYIDIATESDLSAVNYAYIPDYDRYYFINDIVYNRGLWELSMQVDVLASYRNTIGNTELYILRSSHTWNSYYSDRDYPANGNVTPVEITIDNSGGNLTYSKGYYIVTTVSKSVGRTTYQLTGSQFKTIMQQAMGNYGTGFGSLVQGIQNALYNPLDYIVSSFWVPVGFVTDGTARVAFGPWEPTDENGGVITAPIVKDGYSAISYGVNLPKHPQSASYGKYVSMAPFAEYVLDMGFCEPIKLDTTMLVDADRLQITLYPDALTGQALMYAWTLKGSSRQLLFKMTVNYGVPVNMSTVKITRWVSWAVSPQRRSAQRQGTQSAPGAERPQRSAVLSNPATAQSTIAAASVPSAATSFRKNFMRVSMKWRIWISPITADLSTRSADLPRFPAICRS